MSSNPKRTRNDGRPSSTAAHNLTPERAQAANMLAAGVRDQEVADAIGVTQATVCRWRQRPEVIEEMQRLQRQALVGLRARLLAAAETGINSLEDLARHADDEDVRRKAAEALIDKGIPAMPGVTDVAHTTLNIGLSQSVSVEEAKALVQKHREGAIDVG